MAEKKSLVIELIAETRRWRDSFRDAIAAVAELGASLAGLQNVIDPGIFAAGAMTGSLALATAQALKLKLELRDVSNAAVKAGGDLASATRQFVQQPIGTQLTQGARLVTTAIAVPHAFAFSGAVAGASSGTFDKALKAAANYEDALLAVEAASGASAEQIEQLSSRARQLSLDLNLSPTAVMRAFEVLIKNGRTVDDVLSGAGEAVLLMARAADADLATAADIATDAMANFGLQASDMNFVVDQTAGTLQASKFGLMDYRLALGMAGAAAGLSGVSFQDLNAVLSVTASAFTSGSDAGTSFRTFLMRLSPQSKQAEDTMRALGLEFYNANGSLKTMQEVAQELQDGLKGLSAEQQNNALVTIFGTDAYRTAAALARGGGQAVAEMKRQIGDVSAEEIAERRLASYNSQLQGLSGAWTTLAIAIGESGVIADMTSFVKALAEGVTALAELNPQLLKWTAITLAAAAIIAPIALAISFFVQALTAMAPAMAVVGNILAWISGIASAILAAPLLAFVAGITALVGVFAAANWGRVQEFFSWISERVNAVLGPRLQAIIAAASRAFTEFFAAVGISWDGLKVPLQALGFVVFPLLKLLAELAIRALDAIGAALEGFLNILADVIGLVGALITGDWAGAWEHARAIVADLVDAIWNIFAAFFPELMDGLQGWWSGVVAVIRGKGDEIRAGFERTTAQVTGFFAGMPAAIEGFARGIFEGFQRWMGDRFGELVDWVGGKVGEVVGFFRDAWDAVVGHSYVPDMVDGIEHHFGRLDGAMVDPARAACDQVVESFEEAQTDIDEAVKDTMDVVRDGLKGGLRDILKGDFSFGDFMSEIVMRMGEKAIDRAVDLLMDQLDGLLDQMEAALGDILNGIFSGGANDNGLFSSIGSGIGNFFKGMFGGGRAKGLAGGPVFPGRIYDVGEFGREKFVPASAGYILNDNDMRAMGGGRGGVVNHFHFPPGTDARSFQASRGQIESMMLRAAGRGRRNA